jgi:hypothetical protein
MNNILVILSKEHKTWLKYLYSFGCNKDLADDYVQEMYIKIYEYSQKTNNDLMYNKDEINFVFVYVTLRNLYYDSLRKNKNIIKLDETYIPESPVDEYVEDQIYDHQLFIVNDWFDELNSKLDNSVNYEIKLAHIRYIKFIYDKVFIEHMSVSELSRCTGITYWSLRNTINIIKKQIKDRYESS